MSFCYTLTAAAGSAREVQAHERSTRVQTNPREGWVKSNQTIKSQYGTIVVKRRNGQSLLIEFPFDVEKPVNNPRDIDDRAKRAQNTAQS